MPLVPAPGQPLAERYMESPGGDDAAIMCQLLPLLEQTCAGIDVWGLTSHSTLALLAQDDYQSPWFVRITPRTVLGPCYNEVSYSMPADEAPRSDATVSGTATTAAEANALIATAIQRCGGWPVESIHERQRQSVRDESEEGLFDLPTSLGPRDP